MVSVQKAPCRLLCEPVLDRGKLGILKGHLCKEMPRLLWNSSNGVPRMVSECQVQLDLFPVDLILIYEAYWDNKLSPTIAKWLDEMLAKRMADGYEG